MKTLLSILLAALVLSGCSTLSEQECRSADWYRLGVDDGLRGERANLLEKHGEACKRYHILPDRALYLEGRDAGLLEYCRLDNALRLGLNGEKYKGACPLDIDVAFRRHHTVALAVHQSRKRVEELDGQISSKEKELDRKDITDKEKLQLLDDIRKLDRRRDRAREDLHDRERELDKLMGKAKYRKLRD
jgi:hypothetical protein